MFRTRPLWKRLGGKISGDVEGGRREVFQEANMTEVACVDFLETTIATAYSQQETGYSVDGERTC
jgi:hypothetical protein